MFLASKSPQRKALLESLGIDFDIVLPDYREVDPPGAPPEELVVRHSLGKAMSVLPSLVPLSAGRPVLGVDTMVVIESIVAGKAADAEEARGYLRRMSGRAHQVLSGITLICMGASGVDTNRRENPPTDYMATASTPVTKDIPSGQSGLLLRTSHSVTTVKFSKISDEEIDSYLVTGEWRGRAGAYAIQGRASAFVEEIHGDYSNVVGLPVPLLVDMLREIGCWPPSSWTSGRDGEM